jgi:hypothetical protein
MPCQELKEFECILRKAGYFLEEDRDSSASNRRGQKEGQAPQRKRHGFATQWQASFQFRMRHPGNTE